MKRDRTHPSARLGAIENGGMLNRRQMMAGAVAVATAGGATQAAAQGANKPEPAAAADGENGTVWWSELLTKDPERARAFYSRVIGWTPKIVALDDPGRPAKRGEKEYTVFGMGSRESAGAMKIEEDSELAGAPVAWLAYIQVSDVDAASQRAVEAGGKVLNAPFDVPNVGRFAIIEDLEGARFGLVTPLSPTR